MFLTTLFSLPVDVSLADLCLEKETLTLVLKSSQTSAVCPTCTHPSTHVRGRYTRTLADLPCQGRAVRVRLPRPPELVRGKKRQAAPPVKRRLSARHASWWFVTNPQQFTADQRVLIERICHTNADLSELYQLGQDFVQMVKQRQARRLDSWLARASQSSSGKL